MKSFAWSESRGLEIGTWGQLCQLLWPSWPLANPFFPWLQHSSLGSWGNGLPCWPPWLAINATGLSSGSWAQNLRTCTTWSSPTCSSSDFTQRWRLNSIYFHWAPKVGLTLVPTFLMAWTCPWEANYQWGGRGWELHHQGPRCLGEHPGAAGVKSLKTIILIFQTINFCFFLLFPSIYLRFLIVSYYVGCFIPSVFHDKKHSYHYKCSNFHLACYAMFYPSLWII